MRFPPSSLITSLGPPACLLLVAYTNQSLAGFVYLLCFLVWGACCFRSGYSPSSKILLRRRGLWQANAILSGALLFLLLIVQLLAGAGALPGSSGDGRSLAAHVLALCGLTAASSGLQLLRVRARV